MQVLGTKNFSSCPVQFPKRTSGIVILCVENLKNTGDLVNFYAALKLPIEGAQNFTWGEALFLREWGIHAMPPPIVEKNIIRLAEKLESIREILSCPLHIVSWYRPLHYNRHIGGALRSQHLIGAAVDFCMEDISAEEGRALLLPHLIELNIRMENLPDATWIHVDIGCEEGMSKEARFFSPQ